MSTRSLFSQSHEIPFKKKNNRSPRSCRALLCLLFIRCSSGDFFFGKTGFLHHSIAGSWMGGMEGMDTDGLVDSKASMHVEQ